MIHECVKLTVYSPQKLKVYQTKSCRECSNLHGLERGNLFYWAPPEVGGGGCSWNSALLGNVETGLFNGFTMLVFGSYGHLNTWFGIASSKLGQSSIHHARI